MKFYSFPGQPFYNTSFAEPDNNRLFKYEDPVDSSNYFWMINWTFSLDWDIVSSPSSTVSVGYDGVGAYSSNKTVDENSRCMINVTIPSGTTSPSCNMYLIANGTGGHYAGAFTPTKNLRYHVVLTGYKNGSTGKTQSWVFDDDGMTKSTSSVCNSYFRGYNGDSHVGIGPYVRFTTNNWYSGLGSLTLNIGDKYCFDQFLVTTSTTPTKVREIDNFVGATRTLLDIERIEEV